MNRKEIREEVERLTDNIDVIADYIMRLLASQTDQTIKNITYGIMEIPGELLDVDTIMDVVRENLTE